MAGSGKFGRCVCWGFPSKSASSLIRRSWSTRAATNPVWQLRICWRKTVKVVRLDTAGQEVLARAGNFMVARAAFDTSVSLWPVAEIECAKVRE